MHPRLSYLLMSAAPALLAQDSTSLLDVAGIRQALTQAQGQNAQPESTPRAGVIAKPDPSAEQARLKIEREKQEQEVQAAKQKERGPKRFAADLFEIRQSVPQGTEGGVSEDYVLGTGDQLQLYTFGSATFELPLQVDGRGEVVIPKVGSVRVGGMSLDKARRAVQAQVAQNFSKATVDLSVIKLREVRVFILGEVYKPGSYLIPSLSSLVNVLGLAGGPSAAGSFRQIRVLRGGKLVHALDLYPLRAEGLGNQNFYFQNGDTVFVPLAFEQVLLEGAFTRVVAATGDLLPKESSREDPERQRLEGQIRRLETQLQTKALLAREGGDTALSAKAPDPTEALALQEQIQSLKDQLRRLGEYRRGDQRIRSVNPADELASQPSWLAAWQAGGTPPSLQFEMIPGETAADALRYAGGLTVQAFKDALSLRRLEASGAWNAVDLPMTRLSEVKIQRGDVLQALPRREQAERVISIQGWVRVPGSFSRSEGARVGDLLKREKQLLPDTYLGRGEIIRTLPDGRTRYLAFDVSKALSGEEGHNLILENRDRIELYRNEDLRIRQTVSLIGPFTKAGTFEFHQGMRAADLIFRAGVPRLEADGYTAELAHMAEGRRSEVIRLDLARLTSSESTSPVGLQDDVLNPVLRPYDQISIYAQPDFRVHRVVAISGQVVRPGSYALDKTPFTLRDLLHRAGGLTPDAMPKAGIFLRRIGQVDPEKARGAAASGITEADPTAAGINDILSRLDETIRQPTSGLLLRNPLLHGLRTGSLNRLVVDLQAALSGDSRFDLELQDGDDLIVPRKTDTAYVVGETASPFAAYKLNGDEKVRDLLRMAGGPTRNADSSNIRLLKADGRILDSWIQGQKVEAGDAVIVPQRIRRDVTWQESLNALTPLALILNAVTK